MTRSADTAMMVTEGLREDHRNIARLLHALERQIDDFANAGSPDYDVIVGVADYFLQYPDRCHHPKEDLIVATLKERHQEIAGGVRDLIDQHAELHEQALRFRSAVGNLLNGADAPRAAIVNVARDFIASQYRHMREEEDALFPLAESVLTPAEWIEIEDRLSRRADRANGPWVEEMFRSTSAQLLAWQAEGQQSAP